MRKTMKESTLRDNQSHDDVTVSIATAIVKRNLTTPPRADEDGRVDSSSSQCWFRRAARRGRRDGFSSCQRGPTIASERRRKPAGRVLGGVVQSSLRRPAAKKAISGERQPTDDRPSGRSRRTNKFEAAENFIDWFVGISC